MSKRWGATILVADGKEELSKAVTILILVVLAILGLWAMMSGPGPREVKQEIRGEGPSGESACGWLAILALCAAIMACLFGGMIADYSRESSEPGWDGIWPSEAPVYHVREADEL